jgi:UDP-N-acetylglucosamine acyltransferase
VTLRSSSAQVHPTAIIHPDACLGKQCSVGPHTIIEPNVTIGAGTTVASNVLIGEFTRIGEACKIHHGAVVGTIPQDLKFEGEESTLEIGDRTTIREFATLNRGTKALGKTVIGHDVLLMAYVHVAHDCIIGNHVILSNGTQLGGHVEIEDYVISGGLVAIHQFVKIGKHAMISGGGKVSKDICPYIKVAREPLKPVTLNTVGLKRRGFSEESLVVLKQAFRLLFRSHLNISQAVEAIEKKVSQSHELDHLLQFIRKSAARSKAHGRGILS